MTPEPKSLDMLPAVVVDATWTLREFRREARRAAGLKAKDTRPVVVAPGVDAPRLEGEGSHHTNLSGEWVRYPSAYARRGWSSLVYVPSTLRVVVGADWHPGSVQ